MPKFRSHVYEDLGAARTEIVERIGRESAAYGLASELRGSVALSGSQSVRPPTCCPKSSLSSCRCSLRQAPKAPALPCASAQSASRTASARSFPSYNGYGVEVNYVDTWRDGRAGIPIFNNEDKTSGTNLVIAGLAALGYQAPSAEDGNISITTGRGLVDPTGRLMSERARAAARAMVRVLEILDDTTQEIARQ